MKKYVRRNLAQKIKWWKTVLKETIEKYKNPRQDTCWSFRHGCNGSTVQVNGLWKCSVLLATKRTMWLEIKMIYSCYHNRVLSENEWWNSWFIYLDWSQSECVRGHIGLTELLSGDLGWVEREWICKERMNILPKWDLHQFVHWENQVFRIHSCMNNVSTVTKAKAAPLHTLAVDGGEWSASDPGHALAPRQGPPVPIVQEAEWAPEPVWTQRLQEKSCRLCQGSNLDCPVFQPVARHYTDWTTQLTSTVTSCVNKYL
jgi:hypothetical protein